MNKKFMFESFAQYAEIMNIQNHPYYDAMEIVWRMARSPAFAEDETETTEEQDAE